jgi:6-phosphogluconolactonase
MQNFELISFATADELAQAVASAWLDEIETANRAGKSHCVALSGGRIAKTFYSAGVNQSQARAVSLQSVHFFWADERCVPPDDAESNSLLAQESLLTPLKILANQIHRVRGELPPDKAAELATEEILGIAPTVMSSPPPPPKEERVGVRRPIMTNPLIPALSPFERGEGEAFQPVLDLIFLGIGEDGHVASLFPGEPEAAISDKAVYRAVKNSPKPPPNRVTLGYAAIAAARQVWVLASGAGKERVLADSLKPTGRTPLARVLKLRSATKIFTDIHTLKS